MLDQIVIKLLYYKVLRCKENYEKKYTLRVSAHFLLFFLQLPASHKKLQLRKIYLMKIKSMAFLFYGRKQVTISAYFEDVPDLDWDKTYKEYLLKVSSAKSILSIMMYLSNSTHC